MVHPFLTTYIQYVTPPYIYNMNDVVNSFQVAFLHKRVIEAECLVAN